MMHVSRRTLTFLAFSLLFVFCLFFMKLPFYIYKPGDIAELTDIVTVEHGHVSNGELHLVTVSRQRATPVLWALAKMANYNEIIRLEDAIPEGYTEDEYKYYQMKMMESSHHAAIKVAFEAANFPVAVEDHGVYVLHVRENMPAHGKLTVGDKIVAVDGQSIAEASELVNYVQAKTSGAVIQLTFERAGKTYTEKLEVTPFPDDPEQVGIGIQLYTDKDVTTNPQVEINSGNIGGPSAGLMFALEIYNQLVKEDVTKGYNIAGTGELDFQGNIHRIGGVEKKVVAAAREDIEIFFVPYEQGRENANYFVAKETAEAIETDMEIVPVDTFAEALTYLKQLPPKTLE